MSGKSRSRTIRRAVIVTAMAAFVALVVDGFYVLASLPSPARAIVEEASSGRDRLSDAEFDGARRDFEQALGHADTARGLLRHPAAFVAQFVPRVGSDVRALGALVDSSRDAARAGLEVVDAARALGASDEGLAAAIYRRGRVRLDALEEAAPAVDRAAVLMANGLARVEAAPRPSFSLLRSAHADALELLGEGARATSRARDAFEVVPGMLGGEGGRRYFLMFQAPSEARATGGLLGFYGILEADDGSVELTRVGPIHELSSPDGFQDVEAPEWHRDLYGPLGALSEWRQVNTSINFPMVSSVVLQMYESSTGERLDGVVAMDPIALGEFTRGTGPLRAPGLDVAIGPKNARRVLLREIYEVFEHRPEAQDAYLRALIEEFWASLDSDVDARALLDGVGSSLAGGNFKVFSAHDEEQTTLVSLDAAGRYPPGMTQAVFHNNASANKIDYFLQRTQHTDITVDSSGRARVRVEVHLENRADPSRHAPLLVGPNVAGDDPGTNAMSLFFLLPQGAQDPSFSVDGRPTDFLSGTDAGAPVVWDLVAVPAGASSVVVCEYAVALPDEGRLTWTLYPQPLPRPDRYTISVRNPERTLLSLEGDPSRGTLDRPRTVALDLP